MANVPCGMTVASIGDLVTGESVILRSILEDCRTQQKFHIHYDIGFKDTIKNLPNHCDRRDESDVYLPFGAIESNASVQFGFEIPMQELPMGSLVSPLARAAGTCGMAWLRAGEYQLQGNQPVKKITFHVTQAPQQQPFLQIGMHANVVVPLGANAILEAFSKVNAVFQTAILAKSSHPR